MLIGTDKDGIKRELQVWAHYSERDGGILKGIIPYPEGCGVRSVNILEHIHPSSDLNQL